MNWMEALAWKAYYDEDRLRHTGRLVIGRNRPDGMSEVLTAGDLEVTVIEPGVLLPENAGILLPSGVWQAIVKEAVGQGDRDAEVARLEEALRVEQERVDRILFRHEREGGSW